MVNHKVNHKRSKINRNKMGASKVNKYQLANHQNQNMLHRVKNNKSQFSIRSLKMSIIKIETLLRNIITSNRLRTKC